MLSVRSSFVVVGCVFVGFITSAGPGLVARAAEPQRWGERGPEADDEATPPGGGEAQRRSVQLEQPLKELAVERRGTTSGDLPPGQVTRELRDAIARNHELMAQNRALTAENQALAQSQLFEPPATASTCEPPPLEADPRAQLRYWAARLRDSNGGLRDRLTAEQSSALNVLLRRQRALDPNNPWREQ